MCRRVTSYNTPTVRLCVNTGKLVSSILLAVSFWIVGRQSQRSDVSWAKLERAKSEKRLRRPRLVSSNSVLTLVRMIAHPIVYVERDC